MSDQTGEPSTHERTYASVPDRLAALLIDAIVVTVLIFAAAIVLSIVLGPAVRFETGADSVDGVVNVRAGIAVLDALAAGAIGAVYFVRSWSRGGSYGQRRLGLALQRSDAAQPPSSGAAWVRWIVLAGPFVLSSLITTALPVLGPFAGFCLIVWYLGMLVWTARDERSRGLHDLLSKTIVTRAVRPVVAPAPAPAPEVAEAALTGALTVARPTDVR